MMRSARSAMLALQRRKGNHAGNIEARAAGLRPRQGLDPLHGGRAAHGELLVEQHVFVLPADFVRRELAQHARGMPAASERAGMRASALTNASAATTASSPTSALSLTTAFMPMS